jgi:hypothetical protein
MKLHSRIMFKRKVRKTFGPLGHDFVVRMRARTLLRNNNAADAIHSLLISVRKEDRRTGGRMRMVRACVKISSIRKRTITLQRWWRRCRVQLAALLDLTLQQWDSVSAAAAALQDTGTAAGTAAAAGADSGHIYASQQQQQVTIAAVDELPAVAARSQQQQQQQQQQLVSTSNLSGSALLSEQDASSRGNNNSSSRQLQQLLQQSATAMLNSNVQSDRKTARTRSNKKSALHHRAAEPLEPPLEVKARVLKAFLRARRLQYVRRVQQYVAQYGKRSLQCRRSAAATATAAAAAAHKRKSLLAVLKVASHKQRQSAAAAPDSSAVTAAAAAAAAVAAAAVTQAATTTAIVAVPATAAVSVATAGLLPTPRQVVASPRTIPPPRPHWHSFLQPHELAVVVEAAAAYMKLLAAFWDPRQPSRSSSGALVQVQLPESIGWQYGMKYYKQQDTVVAVQQQQQQQQQQQPQQQCDAHAAADAAL